MIQPIIAAQTATPVAAIQHNNETQGILQSQNATKEVEKEQQQSRETVIKKDEAVFYQQKHDAKEEGKNKYANLYSNKKKKVDKDKKDNNNDNQTINRVNFEIKI